MIEVKASEVIDYMYDIYQTIEKTAKVMLEKEKDYLAPIVCEQCGYEGIPDTYGRCPDCGALDGMSPKETNNVQENNTMSGHAGIDSIPAHEMGMSDINDMY